MANYPNTSPWFKTKQNSVYLEPMVYRPITIDPNDKEYVIEQKYMYRPDLLSFDLYGTPKLWWIIIQRNLDVIQDPIYDFVHGLTIRIPSPNLPSVSGKTNVIK